MTTKELASRYIGGNLRDVLAGMNCETHNITEIRIRVNKPLCVRISGREYFIASDGTAYNSSEKAYKPTANDINNAIELMSNYSLYAFEEELKNGYITLSGGHRVGICGQAVLNSGEIRTLKNINGLNIRITHEVKGCASKIINYIAKPSLKHTMIISPPGCGKTTLVRDVTRLLSEGDPSNSIRGHNIGIADERSEIAACYMGIPQNDVGIRSDVLDACPKAKGMIMLLRSMSPEIIVADEIGREEDVCAIDEIANSGVKLICTAHGFGIDDLKQKETLSKLLAKKIFQVFIVLKNSETPGEISGVYDSSFNNIYVG